MRLPSRFTALRVVYAGVLLEDILYLAVHLDLFPHAAGMRLLLPALIVWAIALLSLAIGYHLRPAAIVNYLCCSIILGWYAPNGGFQQAAADSIIISLALIVLIAATIRLPLRLLLAIYLSSVYLDSGLHKIASPMWRAGLGVSLPLGLPSLVWQDMSFLQHVPAILLRLFGWAVIVFELGFPALYFWRPTRLSALLTGIAMHLGIAFLYPIPAFSGIMLAIYAALLPDSFYRDPEAPLVIPRLRRKIAIAILWLAAIGLVYLPIPSTGSSLRLVAKAARKASFMLTGVASHEVFADNAFEHYTYQWRLVDSAGRSFPYNQDGLLPFTIRDRVWEQWWKRTQGPFVTPEDAQTSLRAWASGLADTSHLEARSQRVPMTAVLPSLFVVNNRTPWIIVGELRRGS